MLGAAAVAYALLSRWVPRMVSFAVGAMLGATFLHMVPEAMSQADSIEALCITALAGLLGFFLLEKASLWRHRHEHHGHHGHHGRETRIQHAAPLILVGDGLHNVVDGVLIAAAFLVDHTLGVTTALAIIAHEIPQEVGDFMVLLQAGYSRARAFALNLAASLTSVAGGVLGYVALDGARSALPYVLMLAAASFIYIAVADLIPELNRRNDSANVAWQVGLVGAGVAVIGVIHLTMHHH